jgi:hypothetical protein
MSNATQQPRQSGDGKRRRSRGGRNRNNKQHQDKRHGGERGFRDGRGGAHAEEFRPQGPRQKRERQPVKLSWWQKLLKAIGLYKGPAKPERRSEPTRAAEPRTPKSNTRVARSGDGPAKPDAEQPAKRAPRGGDRSSVESSRVYVGNLSYDVSEQDLQELFKGIGGVRNVEIVYNRSTHRSKGYGFVEMLHKDEAMRAVEVLHDQPFMGRKLIVSGAKSKGQDEREEREEREESSAESRIVSLAPLPAAVAAETAPAEPVIPTIVEDAAESATAESQPRSEVA